MKYKVYLFVLLLYLPRILICETISLEINSSLIFTQTTEHQLFSIVIPNAKVEIPGAICVRIRLEGYKATNLASVPILVGSTGNSSEGELRVIYEYDVSEGGYRNMRSTAEEWDRDNWAYNTEYREISLPPPVQNRSTFNYYVRVQNLPLTGEYTPDTPKISYSIDILSAKSIPCMNDCNSEGQCNTLMGSCTCGYQYFLPDCRAISTSVLTYEPPPQRVIYPGEWMFYDFSIPYSNTQQKQDVEISFEFNDAHNILMLGKQRGEEALNMPSFAFYTLKQEWVGTEGNKYSFTIKDIPDSNSYLVSLYYHENGDELQLGLEIDASFYVLEDSGTSIWFWIILAVGILIVAWGIIVFLKCKDKESPPEENTSEQGESEDGTPRHRRAALLRRVGSMFPMRTYHEVKMIYVYLQDIRGISHQCSICLEDFEEVDECRMLHCNHVFHVKCIDEWLPNQESCPLCISPIFGQLPILNKHRREPTDPRLQMDVNTSLNLNPLAQSADDYICAKIQGELQKMGDITDKDLAVFSLPEDFRYIGIFSKQRKLSTNCNKLSSILDKSGQSRAYLLQSGSPQLSPHSLRWHSSHTQGSNFGFGVSTTNPRGKLRLTRGLSTGGGRRGARMVAGTGGDANDTNDNLQSKDFDPWTESSMPGLLRQTDSNSGEHRFAPTPKQFSNKIMTTKKALQQMTFRPNSMEDEEIKEQFGGTQPQPDIQSNLQSSTSEINYLNHKLSSNSAFIEHEDLEYLGQTFNKNVNKALRKLGIGMPEGRNVGGVAMEISPPMLTTLDNPMTNNTQEILIRDECKSINQMDSDKRTLKMKHKHTSPNSSLMPLSVELDSALESDDSSWPPTTLHGGERDHSDIATPSELHNLESEFSGASFTSSDKRKGESTNIINALQCDISNEMKQDILKGIGVPFSPDSVRNLRNQKAQIAHIGSTTFGGFGIGLPPHPPTKHKGQGPTSSNAKKYGILSDKNKYSRHTKKS